METNPEVVRGISAGIPGQLNIRADANNVSRFGGLSSVLGFLPKTGPSPWKVAAVGSASDRKLLSSTILSSPMGSPTAFCSHIPARVVCEMESLGAVISANCPNNATVVVE